MQNGISTKMAIHEFAWVQVTSVVVKRGNTKKLIKNKSSMPDAGYTRGLALYSSVKTINIEPVLQIISELKTTKTKLCREHWDYRLNSSIHSGH